MAQHDLILAPESLEALLGGLGEIATALGPSTAPGIAAMRARLQAAVAARHAGERDRCVAEITAAMQHLAQLADALDPREAAMMRAVAAQFEGALRRGDAATAAQNADLMRDRSGARKKRGDENKL